MVIAMKNTKTESSEPAKSNSRAEETGEHLQHVRRRFTETAGAFAEFVLAGRVEEFKHAAEVLTQNFQGLENAAALDLCCGPGPFVRALAARVKFAAGLDITPAMLARAREATSCAGLSNVAFACG